MSSRYQAQIDLDQPNNTHASLVRMVGENKRVLELGAASGYMTTLLKSRGCSVTAIEYDPDAIDQLMEIADRAIIGDLNDPAVLDAVSGPFDVVLAGDVLEHLLDPLAVLRRAVSTLTPDGEVVISIPNVGHIDLRLGLMQGRFDYRETGLLDATHIRFFTYDTFLDLIAQAGLLPVEIHRIIALPFETELAVPRSRCRRICCTSCSGCRSRRPISSCSERSATTETPRDGTRRSTAWPTAMPPSKPGSTTPGRTRRRQTHCRPRWTRFAATW